jgi:hypothetical protein
LDDAEVAGGSIDKARRIIILNGIRGDIMVIRERCDAVIRGSIIQLMRVCLDKVKGRHLMKVNLALEGAGRFAEWFSR